MVFKHQIGHRTRAAFRECWIDKTRTLYQAWCPQIEVDGKLMCISDPSTPTRCIELPTQQEAVEYAKNYRNELKGITA